MAEALEKLGLEEMGGANGSAFGALSNRAGIGGCGESGEPERGGAVRQQGVRGC